MFILIRQEPHPGAALSTADSPASLLSQVPKCLPDLMGATEGRDRSRFMKEA